MKYGPILLLVSALAMSSCDLIIFSDSSGLNIKRMASSKRSVYSSTERGKIKSPSLLNLRRNKFYFIVNKAEEENFNWLFFMNRTDSLIVFECEDGQPKIIQEAVNKEGNWKAIEYWRHSMCGNSYGICPINPNEYAYYKIHKYDGDYLTYLRVKIKINYEIYYSPTFLGRINEEQFERPARVEDRQINW